MDVPYANASSGHAARDEISRLLRLMGASKVGFMDEYETSSVLVAFEHRGRQVQLRASAKGWAAMHLRRNPWNTRRKTDRKQYEQKALNQGMIAINSILRDWVKGMVTAIECDIFTFDTAFLPYMITEDGRTVAEVVLEAGGSLNLLPPPKDGGQ